MNLRAGMVVRLIFVMVREAVSLYIREERKERDGHWET